MLLNKYVVILIILATGALLLAIGSRFVEPMPDDEDEDTPKKEKNQNKVEPQA